MGKPEDDKDKDKDKKYETGEKFVEETAKYVLGGSGGYAATYVSGLSAAAAANVANASAVAALTGTIQAPVIGSGLAISGCVVPMGSAGFTFGTSGAAAAASAASNPAMWALAINAINPTVLVGVAVVLSGVGCWYATKTVFGYLRG
jgi:hypothetical protein